MWIENFASTTLSPDMSDHHQHNDHEHCCHHHHHDHEDHSLDDDEDYEEDDVVPWAEQAKRIAETQYVVVDGLYCRYNASSWMIS